VPYTRPILVTSLQPGVHFSEICETLVVNAHGCAVRSPMRLDTGAPLHFHSQDGRETMARVIDCQPLGSDHEGWMVGAQLDQPANFWGLQSCPEDWGRWAQIPTSGPAQRKPSAAKPEVTSKSQKEPALKLVPDKAQPQLSDDQVKTLVADTLRPLQSEVADLKEKLGHGEPKRSSFEVSLSYIPPELEEKLWVRLRQDLGAQVLRHANEQAEQVLGSARATIEEKITEAQGEFRQQLTQELQGVEERAQGLSEEIDENVRRHLRGSLDRFQQHVLEAGTHLERRGDEFFQSLQRRLNEEQDTRLREIQEVQTTIESESSRLQALVADLGTRVKKLDESAHRLESDLDMRLAKMSNEILGRARTQLENDVQVILEEMGKRNAEALGGQLEDAGQRLRSIQTAIEVSLSESLRARVEDTLQSFKLTMEDRAADAVGRWRLALAKDLSSVAAILGDEVRQDVSNGESHGARAASSAKLSAAAHSSG
jgi:hypothetical protein